MTTTELRTKTKELVKALENQEVISLVHRSKIIGEVMPKRTENVKTINSKRLANALKKFEPTKRMIQKQIMKIYDHYMMFRHGPRVY